MKVLKYSHNNGENNVSRHILYPIYWDIEKMDYYPNKKGHKVTTLGTTPHQKTPYVRLLDASPPE
jgi:hypothetical protein